MTARPVAARSAQLVPDSRYRHPGDVIRLICGGVVLGGALAASWAASRWLLGSDASVLGGGFGSGAAGRALTGLVQVACVTAAALVVAATLRYRRFRLLGGLAIAAAVAALAAAGIFYWLGGP